MTFNADILPLD